MSSVSWEGRGWRRVAPEPPPPGPWGFCVFSHDFGITGVSTAGVAGHVLGKIANNKFPVLKRSRHVTLSNFWINMEYYLYFLIRT